MNVPGRLLPVVRLNRRISGGNVYYEDSDGRIRFRRLAVPDDSEVARVTAGMVKSVGRLLERRGLEPQANFRKRILCAINPPDAIKKILDCRGLPSRPPPGLLKCYGPQAIYLAVSGSPF